MALPTPTADVCALCGEKSATAAMRPEWTVGGQHRVWFHEACHPRAVAVFQGLPKAEQRRHLKALGDKPATKTRPSTLGLPPWRLARLAAAASCPTPVPPADAWFWVDSSTLHRLEPSLRRAAYRGWVKERYGSEPYRNGLYLVGRVEGMEESRVAFPDLAHCTPQRQLNAMARLAEARKHFVAPMPIMSSAEELEWRKARQVTPKADPPLPEAPPPKSAPSAPPAPVPAPLSRLPLKDGRVVLLRTIKGRPYAYLRHYDGVTAKARPRYVDRYVGRVDPQWIAAGDVDAVLRFVRKKLGCKLELKRVGRLAGSSP